MVWNTILILHQTYDYYHDSITVDSNNNNTSINISIETQELDVILSAINRNIRINFSNLESFYLYSIKFYGNTANKCLYCDSIQFNYFDFDASDNDYVGNCLHHYI